MPTLNYENTGALVSYDYLQGTITALNSADDTADVSGVCGSLSGIPIFYHCEPDSVARSNGAIEGAAGGFAVGDLVVVLKAIGQASSSLYSLDQIELKGADSTATGPKYYVVGHYDGVRPCSAIQFLLCDNTEAAIALRWYSLSGVEQKHFDITTENTTFFDESSWSNTIGRIDFLAGWQGLNSALLRVYLVDLDENFISWLYLSHRVPVTVKDTEKKAWLENIILQWSPIPSWVTQGFKLPYFPKGHHNSKFGMQLNCTYFPDDKSPSWFLGNYTLHQDSVFGIRHYTVPFSAPADAYAENIFCTCPSLYKNNLMMAIASFDSAYFVEPNEINPTGYWKRLDRKYEGGFIEAFIAVWPADYFVEGNSYYWRTSYSARTGGALADCTKLIPLSKNQFYQLSQIECVNDKIYIFSDSGKGFRPAQGNDPSVAPAWDDISQAARVDVYGLNGSKIDERVFDQGYIDRVSIVQYGARPMFCFRLMDTEAGGYSSMMLVDVATLETVKTVSLPQWQAIAVNVPLTNYMLQKVNTLRSEQDWILDFNGNMREVAYLGYSLELEVIASEHLAWCVANCRLSHEDVNGDTIEVRAMNAGVYHARENLSFIPVSTTQGEIDAAMEGWIASPLHLATMIDIDEMAMGYASIILPATCTELIVGPGAYIEGEYTTGDTVIGIPEDMRGKYKLFCQVFSIG